MRVVCGDIGGTKSLLAIVDEGGRILREERFDSRAHARFDDIVRAFLAGATERPARACFAIAGRVQANRCKATNLPWEIDGDALGGALDLERCLLVNDFHAQALAVLELPAGDRAELHPGTSDGGPIAVLGAGTGLGEAFLCRLGDGYEVLASEGGHCTFAPVGDEQERLLRFLTAKVGGHVSYERILSGQGLVNVYDFACSEAAPEASAAVREAMRAAEHPAAVITERAATDPLCRHAVAIFCEIYGQEASNLALKLLTTGGVYLCGGIAPRILDALRDGAFTRGYLHKGRFSDFVRSIPVRVVTNPRSGLLGAAALARRV
jgi:glucokinase